MPQSSGVDAPSVVVNVVDPAQKYLLKGLWAGADIVINPMDAIVSGQFSA